MKINNKKLTFIIIGLAIFIIITGGIYWYWSKSNLLSLPRIIPFQDICGDNICSDIEKFSKTCEKDCEGIIESQPKPATLNLKQRMGLWSADPLALNTKSKTVFRMQMPSGFQPFVESGIGWIWLNAFNRANADYLTSTNVDILAIIPLSPEGTPIKPGVAPKLQDNLIEYDKFLKETARKYKGKIGQWILIDEPEGEWGWNDSPENYALLLRLVYRAIKSEDPNAKIMLGKGTEPVAYDRNAKTGEFSVARKGFFQDVIKELRYLEDLEKQNPHSMPDEFKRKHPSVNEREFSLIISADNFNTYFDLAGIGVPGGKREKYTYFIQVVKNVLYPYAGQIPIWQTDRFVCFSLEPPLFYQEGCDERKQAKEMLDTLTWMLTQWTERSVYNTFLTNLDDSKRLVFYSVKKLIEEIVSYNNIQLLSQDNNVYVYKITGKNLKEKHFALWDTEADSSYRKGQTKTITLNVGNIKQVKITKAIPKYNTGKEVKNYNTAFETKTAAVSNGQLTLTLDEDPVYVEESDTQDVTKEPLINYQKFKIGLSPSSFVIDSERKKLYVSYMPDNLAVYNLDSEGLPFGKPKIYTGKATGLQLTGIDPVRNKLYLAPYQQTNNLMIYNLDSKGYPFGEPKIFQVGKGASPGPTNLGIDFTNNNLYILLDAEAGSASTPWYIWPLDSKGDPSVKPIEYRGIKKSIFAPMVLNLRKKALYLGNYPGSPFAEPPGVYIYSIDKNGLPRKETIEGIYDIGTVWGLALDANRNKLYVAARHPEEYLYIYDLDEKGLPKGSPQKYDVPKDAGTIILDPTRNRIYIVANGAGGDPSDVINPPPLGTGKIKTYNNNLYVYDLNKNGYPIGKPSIYSTGNEAYMMVIDPIFNKLYLSSGGDSLHIFDINQQPLTLFEINNGASLTDSPDITLNLQIINAQWIMFDKESDLESVGPPFNIPSQNQFGQWISTAGIWSNDGGKTRAQVLNVPARLKQGSGTKKISIRFQEPGNWLSFTADVGRVEKSVDLK